MNLPLSPAQLEALALMLSRMTFADYLALTDGDGDENQAYFFQEVATALKKALNE